MRSAPARETWSRRLYALPPQEVFRQLADDARELQDGYHSCLAARGAADLEQLRWMASWDNADLWRSDGARSTGEWIATHFGISRWKANRMISAGHALKDLPLTSAALASGTLSLDKVVELTRFATPDTERKLITWARRVTPAGVRERADKAAERKLEDAKAAFESRSLKWWQIDPEWFGFEGILPSDQGAAFRAAIDRLAGTMPDLPPDEEGQPQLPSEYTIDQRRADALMAMASAQIASDSDPDLATIVVTIPLEAAPSGSITEAEAAVDGAPEGGTPWVTPSLAASLDGMPLIAGIPDIDLGPAIPFETACRLSCDCRLEVARVDGLGDTVGVGRATRKIPRWLRRQLMRRDRHTCQFPGCGAQKFLHCHHVWHWLRGGPTNLDNLIALCPAHHRLVHEFGWGVKRDRFGEVTWFRPSGRIFEPGPRPANINEFFASLPPPEPPKLIEANKYSRWVAIAASL